MRDIVNAVLKNLDFVGFFDERVKANADFTLTCGAHFVVVNLDRQTHLFHGGTHGCADIVQMNRRAVLGNNRLLRGGGGQCCRHRSGGFEDQAASSELMV